MNHTPAGSNAAVALITGAGTGIGRAISLELAEAGLSLALVGRHPEPLHEVATLARQHGAAEARVFAYDLAHSEGIPSLVNTIHAEMGGPSILINNAGLFVEKPFVETSPEDFRESFAVNFFAVVELVRAAVPFIEQGITQGTHGAIIMMGSSAGEKGYGGGSIYSATKHALRGFSDSLYYDLQEKGIRVALVEPGVVNTGMHRGLRRYAPARMIQPEDVAKTVRFILELPDTACPFLVSVRPSVDPRVSRG